jgi:hypothetical protein
MQIQAIVYHSMQFRLSLLHKIGEPFSFTEFAYSPLNLRSAKHPRASSPLAKIGAASAETRLTSLWLCWGDLRSSIVLARLSIVVLCCLVFQVEYQPLVTLFNVSRFQVLTVW